MPDPVPGAGDVVNIQNLPPALSLLGVGVGVGDEIARSTVKP